MNEEVTKMANQKIQSIMYQIDNTHFQNFTTMIKYLESADAILTDKIQRIDLKMQSVTQQFIRTSSVYEMNNKKRQKQEQLLKLERDRISKDLDIHKVKLGQFKLSPITLILKQKKYQLEKLSQTKQIIEQFNKIIKGKQEEVKKILPLDQKNFNNSAMKIYVFKSLLQDIHGTQYDNAREQINKKYEELKNKIIQNFKQGYWNKDTKLIRNTLPYCEEYELMDLVSQFYNQQIFKSVHKVTKISFEGSDGLTRGIFEMVLQTKQGQTQIKNMFFLIQQGFYAAFSQKDLTTGQNNPNQINMIMGQYSEAIGRKLIAYVFQTIIKQSLKSILQSTLNSASGTSKYLCYLQIFFDQCKILIRQAQKIIKQERTVHLMSTYSEPIFDAYLDTYLDKQKSNLEETYEKCSQQITREISQNSINGVTQFSRDKQKNFLPPQDKKKTIKNLFQYAIQSKKNIFQGSNNKNQSNQQNVNQMSQMIKSKIQALQEIFVSPSLKMIFLATKQALARNKKIAKINDVDKNRNQILKLFLSSVEQIIQNLISLISEVVPPFDEKSPLQPNFFLLVPLLNNQLHEVQLMYQEYKKQNCYQLSDTFQLDQIKQNLMNKCGKSFNKLLGQAMATILTNSSNILQQDINQYNITNLDKAQQNKSCPQVITYLQRYIRVLISGPKPISNFRLNILKTIGLQFVNNLIKYYSQIIYTKQGLSKIFMDVAKYKTLVSQFMNEEVQNKFKLLRSLIDIYVIKNDERTIWQYIKAESNLCKEENQKIIQLFVSNKMKCQKNVK